MFINDWLWYGTEVWWQGAWGSIVVPWLIVGYAFYQVPAIRTSRALLVLIGISFLGSFVSGQWAETPDALSLHLVPVFFVATALLLYRGMALHPLVGFSGCYISLFAADFVHAVWRLHGQNDSLSYLAGIGGAGLTDGLFVFPTCTAALIYYAKTFRLKNKPACA